MHEDRVKKSIKTEAKVLKEGRNLAWETFLVILAVLITTCLAPDTPPQNHEIDNAEVLKQEYRSF